MDYALLDSGHGQKLERFGPVILIRPCSQALWAPRLPKSAWDKASALFEREGGKQWNILSSSPEEWDVTLFNLKLKLKRTEFGHLGLFPEHMSLWQWIVKLIEKRPGCKVLNLFAYTGGATLAAAKAGASVCHVDAAKGIVSWARENAALSKLSDKPIRWIVDDVKKYLARAVRRGEKYDGILLDPPTFGRGAAGEVFKIENDLQLILEQCKALLSDHPLFFLLSCHTPGFTPIVLKQILRDHLKEDLEVGEMHLEGEKGYVIPSGSFVRWAHD